MLQVGVHHHQHAAPGQPIPCSTAPLEPAVRRSGRTCRRTDTPRQLRRTTAGVSSVLCVVDDDHFVRAAHAIAASTRRSQFRQVRRLVQRRDDDGDVRESRRSSRGRIRPRGPANRGERVHPLCPYSGERAGVRGARCAGGAGLHAGRLGKSAPHPNPLPWRTRRGDQKAGVARYVDRCNAARCCGGCVFIVRQISVFSAKSEGKSCAVTSRRSCDDPDEQRATSEARGRGGVRDDAGLAAAGVFVEQWAVRRRYDPIGVRLESGRRRLRLSRLRR